MYKQTLALLLLQFYTVLSQRCCNEAITNGSGRFTLRSQTLNSTTDSISFCLWARPSASDSYYIVNYADPVNETQILVTSREVWVMSEFVSNLSLPANQSTYLCLTWASSAGVFVYTNGTQLAANTEDQFKNGSINFTGLWSIGSGVSTTQDSESESVNVSLPSKSSGFVGSLCGMTIWSDALSSQYISELYQNQTEVGEEQQQQKRSTEYVIIKSPLVSWEDFSLLNSSDGDVGKEYCESEDPAHGIRLGGLDPVASKFVILFLVIIGVIIGFAALFMCSEREIANKRAKKRLKQENNISIDNVSSHSVT